LASIYWGYRRLSHFAWPAETISALQRTVADYWVLLQVTINYKLVYTTSWLE
jgi:hypothetical protein